mmetsp:Transcript_25417/g.50001  ORF Transcript_25417/g.50001 Transcript_25417/m.50001 type:complete len:1401 (-) Transcript_25417:97-4299(-)
MSKGEEATFFGIVLDGHVTVHIPSTDLTLDLTVGTCIGEMSFFEGGTRNADIVSSTGCLFAILTFDDLSKLPGFYPGLSFNLTRLLAKLCLKRSKAILLRQALTSEKEKTETKRKPDPKPQNKDKKKSPKLQRSSTELGSRASAPLTSHSSKRLQQQANPEVEPADKSTEVPEHKITPPASKLKSIVLQAMEGMDELHKDEILRKKEQQEEVEKQRLLQQQRLEQIAKEREMLETEEREQEELMKEKMQQCEKEDLPVSHLLSLPEAPASNALQRSTTVKYEPIAEGVLAASQEPQEREAHGDIKSELPEDILQPRGSEERKEEHALEDEDHHLMSQKEIQQVLHQESLLAHRMRMQQVKQKMDNEDMQKKLQDGMAKARAKNLRIRLHQLDHKVQQMKHEVERAMQVKEEHRIRAEEAVLDSVRAHKEKREMRRKYEDNFEVLSKRMDRMMVMEKERVKIVEALRMERQAHEETKMLIPELEEQIKQKETEVKESVSLLKEVRGNSHRTDREYRTEIADRDEKIRSQDAEIQELHLQVVDLQALVRTKEAMISTKEFEIEMKMEKISALENETREFDDNKEKAERVVQFLVCLMLKKSYRLKKQFTDLFVELSTLADTLYKENRKWDMGRSAVEVSAPPNRKMIVRAAIRKLKSTHVGKYQSFLDIVFEELNLLSNDLVPTLVRFTNDCRNTCKELQQRVTELTNIIQDRINGDDNTVTALAEHRVALAERTAQLEEQQHMADYLAKRATTFDQLLAEQQAKTASMADRCVRLELEKFKSPKKDEALEALTTRSPHTTANTCVNTNPVPMTIPADMVGQHKAPEQKREDSHAEHKRKMKKYAKTPRFVREDDRATSRAKRRERLREKAEKERQGSARNRSKSREREQKQKSVSSQKPKEPREKISSLQVLVDQHIEEHVEFRQSEHHPRQSSAIIPARDDELVITVHEAKKMKSMELFGKQDPYCAVVIGSDKQKTKVINSGGTDCTWEDTFVFPLPKPASPNKAGIEGGNPHNSTTVRFECWDKELIKSDDYIGGAEISLETLLQKEDEPQWITIYGKGKNSNKNHGEIRVTITLLRHQPQWQLDSKGKRGSWRSRASVMYTRDPSELNDRYEKMSSPLSNTKGKSPKVQSSGDDTEEDLVGVLNSKAQASPIAEEKANSQDLLAGLSTQQLKAALRARKQAAEGLASPKKLGALKNTPRNRSGFLSPRSCEKTPRQKSRSPNNRKAMSSPKNEVVPKMRSSAEELHQREKLREEKLNVNIYTHVPNKVKEAKQQHDSTSLHFPSGVLQAAQDDYLRSSRSNVSVTFRAETEVASQRNLKSPGSVSSHNSLVNRPASASSNRRNHPPGMFARAERPLSAVAARRGQEKGKETKHFNFLGRKTPKEDTPSQFILGDGWG